jgi:hypothetical protein
VVCFVLCLTFPRVAASLRQVIQTLFPTAWTGADRGEAAEDSTEDTGEEEVVVDVPSCLGLAAAVGQGYIVVADYP